MFNVMLSEDQDGGYVFDLNTNDAEESDRLFRNLKTLEKWANDQYAKKGNMVPLYVKKTVLDDGTIHVRFMTDSRVLISRGLVRIMNNFMLRCMQEAHVPPMELKIFQEESA